MKGNPKPVLGNWYRQLDQGMEFQVVAYDDSDGIVEIQYDDGDVEAIELDDWNAMALETIEPPHDWTGSMAEFDGDEDENSDLDVNEDDWNESVDDWQTGHSRRGDD